jgi:hypothetical protein
VDIDGPGVIRVPLPFLPPVIGEPAVVVGDDDEVAAADMPDAGRGLTLGVEYLRDAGSGEQDLADLDS